MTVLLEYIFKLNEPVKGGGVLTPPVPPSEPPLVTTIDYIQQMVFNHVVVTSKMMVQTHTKGDMVTFACQTTSEPVSNNH